MTVVAFPDQRAAAAHDDEAPIHDPMPAADRQARLRGRLDAEQLGARGLERMARNPACGLLKALTVASLSPATVVEQVYGEASREGQSPFALGAGNRFESSLFENDAARLLELFQAAGRLTPTENRVANAPALARQASGGDQRHNISQQLLGRKLGGDPDAPNLIVKPRLTVTLLGLRFTIEPDALVAADGEPFYRVIEIKSYPDRGGKTDPADIRGACRQAGVGVIALRAAAGDLGAIELATLVPAAGDLVLRLPGSNSARLRPMTLEGEVDSLERALAAAPRNLEETEALLAGIAPAALDSAEAVDQLPNAYRESCREFCALARRCKQRACRQSDPILIGSRAREEFAAAGSLERVFALIDGAAAASPAEAQLQQRLRLEVAEFEQAVA